jgi:hypothetical protein
MRRTGKAKTSIWRWQERFMEEGFDGLLRDKTRPSRIPPLGADVAKRVVALAEYRSCKWLCESFSVAVRAAFKAPA